MKELTKALLVNVQVVHALILRETRTRFGSHHLGYLWALVGPLLWIGSFAAMFYLIGRDPPHEMTIVQFLATGFCPYLLFRYASGQCVNAINANHGLLYYPQVRPLDLVTARVLLEFATMVVVFTIIVGGAGLSGEPLEADRPLLVMVGFIVAALLGATMGLTLCAAGVFWPAVERLHGPVLRPLIWVSGVWFAANDVPAPIRDILLLNPLLHVTELVRDGWFSTYRALYASVAYPVAWAVALAFVGLTLERVARRHIRLT